MLSMSFERNDIIRASKVKWEIKGVYIGERMSSNFTKDQLQDALSAAGSAHHEYEVNYLNGVRDEMWAGFYAAFVLGKLGDFAKPTELTRWLEEAPAGSNWVADAVEYLIVKLH